MTKATLAPLPYAYDALEPHIDATTLKLHHDIHHQGYVNGYNNALDKMEEARANSDFSLVKHRKKELAFHGSGHVLHSLYWENMTPDTNQVPSGVLLDAITNTFGSVETFEKEFKATTASVEGSGRGALVLTADQELVILGVEKHQDLYIAQAQPLLVCDVREHSYYLKYQNKRVGYIDAFWEVINRRKVEERFVN